MKNGVKSLYTNFVLSFFIYYLSWQIILNRTPSYWELSKYGVEHCWEFEITSRDYQNLVNTTLTILKEKKETDLIWVSVGNDEYK